MVRHLIFSLACPTERWRTSAENLFVVLLISAPPSQELEPPENLGGSVSLNSPFLQDTKLRRPKPAIGSSCVEALQAVAKTTFEVCGNRIAIPSKRPPSSAKNVSIARSTSSAARPESLSPVCIPPIAPAANDLASG